MAESYEYTRNGVTFRKTAVGQERKSVENSEEPCDVLHQQLSKLFEKKNSDISVSVTFYPKTKRPYISIAKATGSNTGMQLSFDADHACLLLKTMALIYSEIGGSSGALNEALEYGKQRFTSMKDEEIQRLEELSQNSQIRRY